MYLAVFLGANVGVPQAIEEFIQLEVDIVIFDEFFVTKEILYSGLYFNQLDFENHHNYQNNLYNVRIPFGFPKGKCNIYVGPKGSFGVSLFSALVYAPTAEMPPQGGRPDNYYASVPVTVE